MSETGASESQIEAAAHQYGKAFAGAWELNIGEAREWAPCFVRPEEAIFLRSDVRIMLDFYEVNNWDAITPDVLARLAAVLDGDVA